MASIYLTDEDYAWVTEGSMKLAHELCAGRVVGYVFESTRAVCAELRLARKRSDGVVAQVSVLEGGYNVPTLARCVTAHVQQLATYGLE